MISQIKKAMLLYDVINFAFYIVQVISQAICFRIVFFPWVKDCLVIVVPLFKSVWCV